MRSEKQTKVVEPEVIDQAIDCSMGLPTLSKSFYMVQARKETPDHVSVREKCLNYSCPKESSLVGINKAILKVKNFGRGICKLIFFIRVVCLSEILLVDGAVEYNP
jgi:hypothetical protein